MAGSPVYILDIGTGTLRGGVAGDTTPRIETPLRPIPAVAVTGFTSSSGREKGASLSCVWQAHRYQNVVKDGRIVDWRCLQRLLSDCLTSLISFCDNCFSTKQDCHCSVAKTKSIKTDRPESAVISMNAFTSSLLPLFNASAAKINPLQQFVEWLFSCRGVKRCQLVSPALMSLYGTGLVSGLVVDVGYCSSRVTPIAEGQSLPAAASTRLLKGSEDITDGLERRLADRRTRLATPPPILEKIKREACFVSLDYDRDIGLAKRTRMFRKEWKLPDNSTIVLDEERFTEPELLFTTRHNTHTFIEDNQTLPTTVGEAIRLVPLDLRRPLLKSILLVGAGSLLPGFAPRLEREVRTWYSTHIMGRQTVASPSDLTTKLIAPTDRQWLPFRGSSLHAQFSFDQKDAWVSQEAYDELGIRAFQQCALRGF